MDFDRVVMVVAGLLICDLALLLTVVVICSLANGVL